jgi:Tfp pilus assembly protein PilV
MSTRPSVGLTSFGEQFVWACGWVGVLSHEAAAAAEPSNREAIRPRESDQPPPRLRRSAEAFAKAEASAPPRRGRASPTEAPPQAAEKGQSGMSLVAVLLATGFFSVVGLGLALVVSTSLRADSNYSDAVTMLNAAEAGLELAARDLAIEADWDLVLSGVKQGRFADGAPSGTRSIPIGGTVSLTAQTNLINCGKPGACTTAQMDAASADRPWGTNNPRWQPYLYGPLPALGTFMQNVPLYLLVWVGDDGREVDEDPLRDGSTTADPGRGVLQLRSEIFGASGARSAVQALVTRVCWTENIVERCLPGVRVQSWREVRQWLP